MLVLQCYASYRLRSFFCNEGARYAIKIGMRSQWRKPCRGNEIRHGFRLTDPEFDDQNAAGRQQRRRRYCNRPI